VTDQPPFKISVSADDLRAFSERLNAMFEQAARQLGTLKDSVPRAAAAWSTLTDGLALGSMKAAGHLGPDVMAACADRAWQMQNTVPLGLIDVETGVPWVVLDARRPSDPRQAVITVQDRERPR
jgi:hypothetical protein